MMFFVVSFLFLTNIIHCQWIEQYDLPFVRETLITESVRTDPDDPAIWIHPTQPELSLLVGTDKDAGSGGLYVYDLDGKIVQHIDNIDRPNNFDVEYGFRIDATLSIDLFVLTERIQQRLRIYSIDINSRQLYELTGRNTRVFTNYAGEFAAPMGIGLYKRPADGRIYAIVSRKTGPRQNYLGQYELIWNGETIDLIFVRYFGDFQGIEIESIFVDDQLGFVYYSDERYGIRKYNVDPNNPVTTQIGFINTTNRWRGDSEGIALYSTSNTEGYLIVTDQLDHGSIFYIYERQGQNRFVKAIQTRADRTDGIDVTSVSLNSRFPHGLLIAMNEAGKNFFLFDWRDFEKAIVEKNDAHRLKSFSFIILFLHFSNLSWYRLF